MSNLVIIPDSVIPSSYASKGIVVVFGADVTPGMPLYLNLSDNGMAWPAACTSSTTANVAGIATTGGGRGQTGYCIPADPSLPLGASLVNGMTYVLSATAGSICPFTDLVSGNFCTILGTTNLQGSLNFGIITGNVAK